METQCEPMFVSIVIITFSMLLFLYWFRYTCLVILNTKTAKDFTAQVAQANSLAFPAVQVQLHSLTEQAPTVSAARMTDLQLSLERDYRLLTGVLRHAAEFQIGGFSVEQRMLMVDYQVMKVWYSLALRLDNASHARQALAEMTDIVAHFANAMGERSVAASRA